MATWTLGNVDDLHAAHPTTFQVPPLWARQQLLPGRLVKLVFEHANGGERMWVEIAERRGGGYVGLLQSQPVEIEELHEADRIEFGAEHIADVERGPRPQIAPSLTATLSNRLRDIRRFPAEVRREAPRDRDDSGFRLLAGDGEDREGDTSQLPLLSVVQMYESVAPLTRVEGAHRWRWNHAECRYDEER